VKNVKQAISRNKRALIREAARKGVSENFGQRRVRKLRDEFFGLAWGMPEERQAYGLIEGFDEWCMSYTGGLK